MLDQVRRRSLTEALHPELAPLGIHATVVEPGYFRADFFDASSLATAVVKLVESGTPPLRLPLGKDTLAAIEQKSAFVAAETEAWRAASSSTGFDGE